MPAGRPHGTAAMETLAWNAAAAVLSLLAIVVLVRSWVKRQPQPLPPLPTEWPLSARPVFTTDERRAFRQLSEALPHHVVLAKLPLVRFSQPSDTIDVRYWYDLLGSINVTFAICSHNGRVLAAIDLDSDRSNSRRILQIKQSVLGACRIRYLRCSLAAFPSAAELQLLVPSGAGTGTRPVQGALPGTSDLAVARDSLATTVASRRAERSALWQDSSLFQDSFFAPDSRQDAFGASDFAALGPAASAATARPATPANAGGPGQARKADPLPSVFEAGGAVVEEDEPSDHAHH